VGRHRIFTRDAAPEERRRRAWRFLLACVGTSLVFFSISSGKRGLYMVPAFPAAALLCADACIRGLSARTALPRSASVVAALFAVLALAVGAESLAAGLGRPIAPIEAWKEMLPALNRTFLMAFGCALIGISSGGVVAWWVMLRNRAPLLAHAAISVTAVFAVELAVFTLLYAALDPIRSTRPISEAAAQITPAGESIGLVGDRSMVGGLVYYTGHHVEALKTPEDIQGFLAEGGRTFVLKRRKLERVEAHTPVEIVGSSRTGRRELVVAIPAGSPPPVPKAP